LITGIAAELNEIAEPSCNTTQKATAKPVDRFEFNDDYVARLRSNDSETWEHFYGYFRPKIRAKFRSQFRWEKVDDLTSETIAAAIEKIRQGDPRDGACLAGYVLAICRIKSLETIRKLENERKLADLDCDLFASTEKSPLQAYISGTNSQQIDKVMAELKPLDRNLLLDIFFYGIQREAVRQKYGVTDDGLRLKLLRARQKFQRKWRRD
jgi:DNA-directed RNA polymerase specialized sigma24 family protein